jgi:hypothetical protein
MTSLAPRKPQSGQRLAVYLMLLVLVGWVVTMMTIEFTQSHHYGYGSGFGRGGRIPPNVAAHYGTSHRQQLVKDSMNDPWDPFNGGTSR